MGGEKGEEGEETSQGRARGAGGRGEEGSDEEFEGFVGKEVGGGEEVVGEEDLGEADDAAVERVGGVGGLDELVVGGSDVEVACEKGTFFLLFLGENLSSSFSFS